MLSAESFLFSKLTLKKKSEILPVSNDLKSELKLLSVGPDLGPGVSEVYQ